jgi:hypothetical protein
MSSANSRCHDPSPTAPEKLPSSSNSKQLAFQVEQGGHHGPLALGDHLAQQLDGIVILPGINGFEQYLDHAGTSQLNTDRHVLFISGIVGDELRMLLVDHEQGPPQGIALETPATDGAGQPALIVHQHPRSRTSIGRTVQVHHGR